MTTSFIPIPTSDTVATYSAMTLIGRRSICRVLWQRTTDPAAAAATPTRSVLSGMLGGAMARPTGEYSVARVNSGEHKRAIECTQTPKIYCQNTPP